MTDRTTQKPKTLAWCLHCNQPLVFTFIVPRHEWYCLTCGGAWAFFAESTVNATEKRIAKAKAVKERFVKLADGLIVSHSKHEDCERCFGPQSEGTYHRDHATAEELAASDAALAALRAAQTKRRDVTALPLRTTTDWFIEWTCGHFTRVIQDEAPEACDKCGCNEESYGASYPVRIMA